MIFTGLLFCGRIHTKIDAVFIQNIMQYFDKLPQEIVYEIFAFVPEYGHRTCKYLHGRSELVEEVSAYCDFYRYCARINKSHIDSCATILTGDCPEDFKMIEFKRLENNRREVLYEYLRVNKCVTICILVDLGFVGVGEQTNMFMYDDIESQCRAYKNVDYYYKVINLYSLMLLCDNGFMTKKEFDAECSSIVDLDTILEIILGVYDYFHHIFNAAIRHFGSRVYNIIDHVHLMQVVVDDIIYDGHYNNLPKHIENIRCRLQVPKIKIKSGDNVLRCIRDRLMSVVNYDNCWDNEDYLYLFTMIESMADEE